MKLIATGRKSKSKWQSLYTLARIHVLSRGELLVVLLLLRCCRKCSCRRGAHGQRVTVGIASMRQCRLWQCSRGAQTPIVALVVRQCRLLAKLMWQRMWNRCIAGRDDSTRSRITWQRLAKVVCMLQVASDS